MARNGERLRGFEWRLDPEKINFSHPNAMVAPSNISMYIKLTFPYPE